MKTNIKEKLIVTGGSGMVGSAIRRVIDTAAPEIDDVIYLSSRDCDLRDTEQTKVFFKEYKPTKIIHLAARVGGVKANNDYVADFFNENILINTNVLMAAHEAGVQDVVSLLSTCVYPDKDWVSYPLTEEQLHIGPPHDSNFGYAYAKRMLDVQSRAYRKQYRRNYITAIPNNIYGIGDNFDLEAGHVVPAVIRKIYEAKLNNSVPVFWGDGVSLREFTYADDIAIVLLKMIGFFGETPYKNPEPCNIGTNTETSIKELVETVAEIFEFKNKIQWDISKPSGQFKKPSKASKITHTYKDLHQGLTETCNWFKKTYPNIRGV